MSIVRLLADGASEAVTLIPLLFALVVATPAHAHVPRSAAAEAVAQTLTSSPPSPLLPSAGADMPTLVAQHIVIELADQDARLRTTSVYRNDTNAPISAQYVLPLAGAVTLHGVDDDVAAFADDAGCGEEADDPPSADADQFIEAGEPDPRGRQTGVLWLEPGDEITLMSVRPADVFQRDARRRVVIALPPPPAGQPVPQFSAEIDVDAPQPIVALGSATHGGEVDGLGGSRARLFIPNGKVYEARFLSIDLELGTARPEATHRWGNEDRLPLAAR